MRAGEALMPEWVVYALIIAASLAAGSKRLTKYGLFGDGDFAVDFKAWLRKRR